MASAPWVMRRCHLVHLKKKKSVIILSQLPVLQLELLKHNLIRRFMDLRSLIGDCRCHQLVDLRSVVRHGEDKEGLVVWQEKNGTNSLG